MDIDEFKLVFKKRKLVINEWILVELKSVRMSFELVLKRMKSFLKFRIGFNRHKNLS